MPRCRSPHRSVYTGKNFRSRLTVLFIVLIWYGRNHRAARCFYQSLTVTSLTFAALLLAACASPRGLDSWATEQDWTQARRNAQGFELALLDKRAAGRQETLHVYLGGDGRPWQGRQPARDPTGSSDLILSLLAADPAPALFLGRPCYHLDSMPPACTPDLWTSGRYSEQVLGVLQDALAGIIAARGVRRLTLVGYSGGGVLAVLLAPRLRGLEAVQVLTVSANLDTAAWTGFHGHLPLSDSINPAEQAPSGVSAVHWHGGRDRVVPPTTLTRYLARHPGAQMHWVEAYDHRCCWPELWPQVLQSLPGS